MYEIVEIFFDIYQFLKIFDLILYFLSYFGFGVDIYKQGHLTNLLGHVIDETKLFLVCFFKTSFPKLFIKFASTPKVGTLL